MGLVRGTIWEPVEYVSVNHGLCIHSLSGHIAAAVLAGCRLTCVVLGGPSIVHIWCNANMCWLKPCLVCTLLASCHVVLSVLTASDQGYLLTYFHRGFS